MAQQPKKIAWKEKKPYGLSASQFGDALGFGGLIWDYVEYRRSCVGTELEFTGNAATAHGIRTEDKSRSLYELLTGTEVHDGSFFLSGNGLLGCSPDGRIFVDDPRTSGGVVADDVVAAEGGPSRRLSSSVSGRLSSGSEDVLSPTATPASLQCVPPSTVVAVQKGVCCVRMPQVGGKRRRPFSPRGSQRVRLLEIKSPVNSLYNGSNEKCKPFGIPLSYMCQMQGQMSISKTDECDFFVLFKPPLV
ncbi:hypothetical protein STCU_08558 [Strigomonas culicis]|uniref:YqaJ viral recombinase domain-containing protein n=1 Tax=Strigomonas culicis TaxID=28005 RepID=S9V3D0_9TRYP|nr:hypothetical protein STCU_08558 [Strigomonas culicis]|eukprot:EPY21421.1 hypothetical protein STCU_08558 [Strigomonas culicis]